MPIMPIVLIIMIKNGNADSVEGDDTDANADTNGNHDDNDAAAAVMLIMRMPATRRQWLWWIDGCMHQTKVRAVMHNTNDLTTNATQ